MRLRTRLLSYAPLIIILLITGFLFFLRLDRNAFSDWDECLYAQYAKEMPQSGHYLTNIWNEYIDMQKPPLYTWLLLAPQSVLGNNEFSLRMISALAGLAIIAAVYIFSRKYFSHATALFASLILLAMELIVIYSLRLNTDVVYALLVFLAVWSWIVSLKKNTYVYIAGFLFGLATMVKGIGTSQFFTAIFLTLFLNPKKEHFVNFIKMGLTTAVIAVPWHLLAYQQYGSDFIRVYIFENILQRGKYPIEFHRERWWYYFVLMYRELRPWLFTAIVFPFIFIVDVFKNLPKKKTITGFVKPMMKLFKKHQITLTIAIVILVPLASLVRFQTRIAWYILPLYPFIAVYLGHNISLLISWISERFLPKQKNRLTLLLTLLVVVWLLFDASTLLANEVKPFKTSRDHTARDEAIEYVRTSSETAAFDELYYLVPFGERQARDILPPTEQIDMTWVYGGHPCAVYYSDKKVNYFYYIDEFTLELGHKDRLYMINLGDESILETQVDAEGNFEGPFFLFRNSDFTIFTY